MPLAPTVRVRPVGRVRTRALGALVAVVLTLAWTFADPVRASASTCTRAAYGTTTYCVGDITALNTGVYPAGRRLVLQDVAVVSSSRAVYTVVGIQQCPPDKICGATITYVKTSIDFSHRARPQVGHTIDVYGTVSTTFPPVLVPRGFVDRGPTPPPCTYC